MPFETPQNGNFLAAAYIVAAVIYLVYAGTLVRRAMQALREGGQGGGGAAGQ